jgi:hypothetical protein
MREPFVLDHGEPAMKLAEALVLRSDHQKRLEQLKQRLIRSAKVQEGERPPEDPAVLLTEADRVAVELQRLIRQINRTNSAAQLGDGTLSDALAERDVLGRRRTLLAGLAEAASVQQDRYSKSEVKFKSTVDVGAVQKQADDLAKEYRELDVRIQETNWRVDLLEE